MVEWIRQEAVVELLQEQLKTIDTLIGINKAKGNIVAAAYLEEQKGNTELQLSNEEVKLEEMYIAIEYPVPKALLKQA